MPDKPQKTVFVLGAGASAASDFKLPVMKGFLQNLNHHDPQVNQLYDYCDRFFPFTYDVGPPQTDFATLSLEDVYTQIELDEDHLASIQGLAPGLFLQQGSGEALDQPTVKQQLLEYVRCRLEIDIEDVPVTCSVHVSLLEHSLLPEDNPDTIITLNYDLIVDEALRSVESDRQGLPVYTGRLDRLREFLIPRELTRAVVPYLLPQERDVGYYLKLHGSLDWLYCPNPGCPNHNAFFPHFPAGSRSAHSAGSACATCGVSLEWVLVPPTMKKSFERFPKLGLIWRLAHEELKAATKVVFFGVSMAPSDYYLHWLIRSSLVHRESEPEVTVINPSEDALDRTRRLTGVNPRPYKSVEQYLDERDS